MEWGIPFPWSEMTDDPLEQFLLAEAVCSKYEGIKYAEMDKERKREEARAKARANLGKG